MLDLEQGIYTKKVMGDHSITFSFQEPLPQEYKVGDTLVYQGQDMIIRNAPTVQKLSSQRYQYNLIFEGARYQLNDMPIMHLGDITFSYFGTAEQYLLLIADNMRSIDGRWLAGFSEETEERWISFDNETCLSALEKVCNEFKLEYDINGWSIELRVKVGVDTGLVLEYGKGKGLYSLTRQSIQNEGVFTRILAYGSTKNLPSEYAGRRLRLSEPLENNVGLYGLKVTTFIDDEIYPKFEGTVESVTDDGLRFTDNSIDFDVRASLLEGLVGKVVFQTGELTGKQFDINFIDGNKIGIKSITEDNDYKYPNSTFQIKAGDKYVFIDIKMPDEYVTDALVRLQEKATEYLQKVSIPQVTYICDIDILHLKRIGVLLGAGDYVTIKDAELGIDKKIRIQSVSYPADYPDTLRNGMTFTCELSDVVTYTTLGKINQAVQENKAEIRDVNYISGESSRNNIMSIREFRNMVFDPDGKMATPLVEAMSAIFGTESQYFDLIGISVSVSGDTINITAGELVHYVLAGAMGDTWELEAYSNAALVTLDSYYISARCSKTTNQGNWVISQAPIGTDDVPGYFHFNLGVLSSNGDGNRVFKPTKMFTTIDGGTIQTNTLIADIIRTRELVATNLNVTGNSRLGLFRVMENAIYFGSGNKFTSNLFFTPDYFAYRTNNDNNDANSIKEVITNSSGASQIAQEIISTSLRTDPSVRAPNIALSLKATNAPNDLDNIAARIEGRVLVSKQDGSGGIGIDRLVRYDLGTASYEMVFREGILINQYKL